jgi:hypothetical protein
MTPSQALQIKPSAWGVFHDGVIQGIEGALPGNLVLTIEIGYLRAMFHGEGSSFRVHLTGCTKMRYCEYDEEPTVDLDRIREREPEILYVTSEQPLVLDCVMGPLELEYKQMTVTLESGVEVSEQELVSASELYWTRWRESTRSDA